MTTPYTAALSLDELRDSAAFKSMAPLFTADAAERVLREFESALLSKLRAPVADERAAFESIMADPLRALLGPGPARMALFEGDAYDSDFVHSAWLAWQARAALASAPVAGEAQKPAAWLHQCRKKPELTQLTMNKREPALAAKGYQPIPLYAAPQASEAVRDALAELVRLQDLKDSKSHQPNPQRSDEWAEYRRLWPTAMEKARADLSAQPGAQKEQSDAN